MYDDYCFIVMPDTTMLFMLPVLAKFVLLLFPPASDGLHVVLSHARNLAALPSRSIDRTDSPSVTHHIAYPVACGVRCLNIPPSPRSSSDRETVPITKCSEETRTSKLVARPMPSWRLRGNMFRWAWMLPGKGVPPCVGHTEHGRNRPRWAGLWQTN